MLVECPKCRKVSCPVSGSAETQTVEHVCPHCRKVIQINLARDKARPSSSIATAAPSGTGRILVVDDTATIRSIAGEILASGGYQVLKAADGMEALKLARQEHPDLILLDLVMPQMTGLDVVREIRKIPRLQNTPILIMTGIVPEKELRADLRAHGVTDFITKNHLMTALAARVPEILARRIDEAV